MRPFADTGEAGRQHLVTRGLQRATHRTEGMCSGPGAVHQNVGRHGRSVGHFDDEFDLDRDVERQLRHSDGGPGSPAGVPEHLDEEVEQPSITCGVRLKPGAQFTMPSVLTTRRTRSSVPSSRRITARS